MSPKKVDELYKDIECICPLCRQTHVMELYWTGLGIPRKYCKPCLSIISGTFNAIKVGIRRALIREHGSKE
jgi:hypothetical protein